jgi:uracil DNA glycosylase
MDVVIAGLSEEWCRVLTPGLAEILAELAPAGAKLCPPLPLILEFARQCPWPPSVVVCGQDPYTDPAVATGLAFSVPRGQPIPPSLRQIARAVGIDPPHGDLTLIARQGCALVNTAFTTLTGRPKAHTRLWRDYTARLFAALAATGATTLAFGRDAQRATAGLPRVLCWGHPSPLNAVNNTPANPAAFIHCPHFKAVNIDWDWTGGPAWLFSAESPVKYAYCLVIGPKKIEQSGEGALPLEQIRIQCWLGQCGRLFWIGRLTPPKLPGMHCEVGRPSEVAWPNGIDFQMMQARVTALVE